MWQLEWWWILLALPVPWLVRRLSSPDPVDRDAALKVPAPGEFVGLTGSPEAVASAAKAYRVAYSKFQEDEAGDDYSIDHSALVYLMGKDGEYVTHFAYGTPPAKMTEKLRRYL